MYVDVLEDVFHLCMDVATQLQLHTTKAQKSHVREMHHFTEVGSVQCAWSYNN